MSFLNKFSRETQEVARYARQIAEDGHQSYIGSTHFFMAILAQRDNFACQILENMGFDTMDVYDEIKRLLVPEVGITLPDELIFTPEIKAIFELAEKEMIKTKWEYIDPIHILLGLLKYKDSEVKQMLRGSGINYKAVFSEYQDAMKSTAEGVVDATDKIFEQVNRGASKTTYKASPRARKKKTNTEALDTFGRNLSALARDGKLDPVVGRDTEINRIWRVLARRKKNNVVLVGEPGCVVGDTKVKIRKIS